MLDKTQLDVSSPSRALREEERELICFMLSGGQTDRTLNIDLESSHVVDMQDGGMGSIRFVRSERRIFGKEVAEAEYEDIDGVLVSISINFDSEDQLFEVDFWKVDFSSLKRYPKYSELVIKRSE
jgi:hypothetical protein